ncbi:MAG: MMPL family transporter [Actinobacteria bacterium]|nr:MAG: MMPL family transporter [Actinomycetota bacterium]
MTALAARTRPASPAFEHPETVGPLGRLGRWAADHVRAVAIAWAVLAVALGIFAPRVESALSGAGWQANGSESLHARTLIQRDFAGLSSSALMVVVHSHELTTSDNGFRQAVSRVERILRANSHVRSVVPPHAGTSISADGHTAVVMAGSKGDATAMVAAADQLKSKLSAAGGAAVSVSLTGASGMWSDFNTANRTAMMRSELFSWPVTMAILVLAFGSLVAAGLPLLLTILGLVASAGLLALLTHGFEISIWAMNFALMFALALGIDYALFVVHRFRGAFFGSKLDARDAVAVTMDTAGKAVLFSGSTVLISLSAVMLVPSPAFRSMALGIMLSVVFVLAATLTLLPAVLAKLGPKVDALALRWVHSGEHRSARFARWGERLWRHPHLYGPAATLILVLLALPIVGLKTAMPSIKVVPTKDGSRVGYTQVQQAFGLGAPGALQIVAPKREAAALVAGAKRDPGIARVSPAQPGRNGLALIQAIPNADPSSTAVGRTIDRLRSELPAQALVGGAAAENHDLERALGAKTPLVIGIVLALGFLLLLVALQAPLIAALGVVTNLLATGAAFGVARLIFQNGHGAGLLGFQSQGFLDAWGPVFFFAMIFAISMDYTVFLLSSAKEHYDRSGDPREASIGALAHSGRVIFAAAAVMVAVFFTFALSGPLPPKEMGVILGIAVLLDAMLVRLVLIPTLLRVFGRYAWALPRWLDRLLPDVSFGHGQAGAGSGVELVPAREPTRSP